MSPRYLRNPPERSDDIAAAILSGTLALGVGLVTFYFARLLFAREPVARPHEARADEAKDVVRTDP